MEDVTITIPAAAITIPGVAPALAEILARLDRIEHLLAGGLPAPISRDFYSTAEAAELLGKAEFTVREWCRLGRIVARKRTSGRGDFGEWMVSAREIHRYRNEGLLPIHPRRNAG